MLLGRIKFEILTWWHAGSGRDDGPVSDAKIIRGRGNLPFLPGRTVKGLVRDAARLGVAAQMLNEGQVVAWFGRDLVRINPQKGVTTENRERHLDEARFHTSAGNLIFGSATLGDTWERWAEQVLSNNADDLSATPDDLITTFASTRIAEDGVAENKTLRVIEAAVPMTLWASIEGPPEAQIEPLLPVLPIFLRGLGSHRNRGLGRVCATLEVNRG